MSIVGIDLGNTSSVIAVAQRGGIDIIINEVSNRQTPTLVSFGEKERYIGETGQTNWMRNVKNTIFNLKCLIGRKYQDGDIQILLPSLPYKVKETDSGGIEVEVLYDGEMKSFSPESLLGCYLAKLKSTAEAHLGSAVRDVVIAIPGYFTEAQRCAILDASSIAGLNCLKIIPDTTASAISYGIYKQDLPESETDANKVMIVDVGQSDTSCSIFSFWKGKVKTLASAYDRTLGGKSIDALVRDHFVTAFASQYKLDLKSNPKALLRLEAAAEKLKKTLNVTPEAVLSVDSLMDDVDVKGSMKKEELIEMCQPLIDRTLSCVKECLASAQLEPNDLFSIEITGGGMRFNPLQNAISEFFGKDLSKTLNIEESVAKGCALQCAILSPVFKVRDFTITDSLQHPINISWSNLGDSMQEDNNSRNIFPKWCPIPSTKEITLKRSEPFKIVFEYAEPEHLPPGTSPIVGQFDVPEIKEANEGSKIKIRVKLTINGTVCIDSVQLLETIEETVYEPAPEPELTEEEKKAKEEAEKEKTETAKEGDNPDEAEKKEPEQVPVLKTRIKRTDLATSGTTQFLPSQYVAEKAEEEFKMIAADKLCIETAEKKNLVESYIYDMRDKLYSELAEFTTDTEKEPFSKLLTDTEDWLYGDGEEETKSVYVAKLGELKKLGDPISTRRAESETREDAVVALRATINIFKDFVASQDEKFAHIEQAERDQVTEKFTSTQSWIDNELEKQNSLQKHQDPILLTQDIWKKKDLLEKFCYPIMNKKVPVKNQSQKKLKKRKKKIKKKIKKPQQQKIQKINKKFQLKIQIINPMLNRWNLIKQKKKYKTKIHIFKIKIINFKKL